MPNKSTSTNHEAAARALRTLIQERGTNEHNTALDYLLDELTASRKSNGALIAERDAARKNYAQLVSDNMRDQQRRDLASVRAVVQKGRVQ